MVSLYIRSFCNSQSNNSILFYIFPTNKNKKKSSKSKQNLFFLFLVKLWLKLSGWIAIDWLLQKFLQLNTLTTTFFFLDFRWPILWFPGKIRSSAVYGRTYLTAVDSDFHDCFRHLTYSDTTIRFVLIEEIKQKWPDPVTNSHHICKRRLKRRLQFQNRPWKLIEKNEITIAWMSWMGWNCVRFHEIFF